jgi:hypothetical protein
MPQRIQSEEFLQELDLQFSGWWAAFLLCALNTITGFRRFGDDDGFLVALALAANGAGTGSTQDGKAVVVGLNRTLSLSEIAVQSGVPLETTRRTLLKFVQAGAAARSEGRYSIVLPHEMCDDARGRARALASVLYRLTDRLFPRVIDSSVRLSNDDLLMAYWASSLRYFSNLRRRVVKGAFIPSLVAGMLQVEGVVRRAQLQLGNTVLSRAAFNSSAEKVDDPIIFLQETALLANETMSRVMASVSHAVELGMGTIPVRGRFRFSLVASRVPDDSAAYTRGVKEALEALVFQSYGRMLAHAGETGPVAQTAD